jgi:hypothetical protein
MERLVAQMMRKRLRHRPVERLVARMMRQQPRHRPMERCPWRCRWSDRGTVVRRADAGERDAEVAR